MKFDKYLNEQKEARILYDEALDIVKASGGVELVKTIQREVARRAGVDFKTKISVEYLADALAKTLKLR